MLFWGVRKGSRAPAHQQHPMAHPVAFDAIAHSIKMLRSSSGCQQPVMNYSVSILAHCRWRHCSACRSAACDGIQRLFTHACMAPPSSFRVCCMCAGMLNTYAVMPSYHPHTPVSSTTATPHLCQGVHHKPELLPISQDMVIIPAVQGCLLGRRVFGDEEGVARHGVAQSSCRCC